MDYGRGARRDSGLLRGSRVCRFGHVGCNTRSGGNLKDIAQEKVRIGLSNLQLNSEKKDKCGRPRLFGNLKKKDASNIFKKARAFKECYVTEGKEPDYEADYTLPLPRGWSFMHSIALNKNRLDVVAIKGLKKFDQESK
ncbi:hypothetical protein L1987_26671 [Smallanthus sonchifolius]|uniref:Uncharacterized protein n=1 Tax=Smallanthus sonchifolius TaxID=185202 RepID=A0ACB9I9T2_9ASTR|nr:hypothetical protein L1987_26671 [Smallanthus sonchifolius]